MSKKITKKIYPKRIEFRTLEETESCPRLPSALMVRESTIDKMITCQRLVLDLFGEYECYGLSLEIKGRDDGIIEDSGLPYQVATPIYVMVVEENVQRFSKELNSDFNVNGWFHGHVGDVGHSHLDDKNIRRILSQTRAYQQVDGVMAKYAYSLVVNADGSSYGKLAVQNPCGAIIMRSVPIEILKGGECFDKNDLKEEIKEKVRTKTLDLSVLPLLIDDVTYVVLNSILGKSKYSDWEKYVIETMAKEKIGLADVLIKVGTPFALPSYKGKI